MEGFAFGATGEPRLLFSIVSFNFLLFSFSFSMSWEGESSSPWPNWNPFD